MTELVKETVTTQENSASPVVSTQTKKVVTNSQTVERLVYFFFGVLEVFLAFRLIFKLAGASLSNAFIGLVYGVSGIFILPFQGIFHQGYTQGINTTSTLEPSTIVALLVYGVLAWGIVKLIRIVR
jgi:hypothetical protein